MMALLHCEKCGVDFDRVLVLSLAIVFGASTREPNVCTDDGEHDWTSEVKKDTGEECE